MIPLVGPNIHFKGFNELSCVDEVLFGKIKLSDLSIMSSNLFVVRSADLRGLICDQLNSSIPLSSANCGFNCFAENTSLNEVFDG